MSSEYLNKTEEQQFEEAKSWFRENSTPILLAIFVFAAASFWLEFLEKPSNRIGYSGFNILIKQQWKLMSKIL